MLRIAAANQSGDKGAISDAFDLASKALRVAKLHALETGTTNVDYREISVEALAAEDPAGFLLLEEGRWP